MVLSFWGKRPYFQGQNQLLVSERLISKSLEGFKTGHERPEQETPIKVGRSTKFFGNDEVPPSLDDDKMVAYHTLQKSNRKIPKIAMFKGSYLFQTIILGIHVSFQDVFSGVNHFWNKTLAKWCVFLLK